MIGRKIIHLESVDSTNNYVANLILQQNIKNGTVILADEQKEGRGQRGAVWSSKSGTNMLFSLYLESEVLSVDKQFVLSQFISLSLVDVLSKLGLLAKIKWPNDIYVNDKKIAGILIENQLSGMKLRSSIVGVGLNVNQIDFENISATSVQLETDEFSSIHTILLSFLFELNKNWKLVESNKFSEINTSYLNSLYRKDVTAIYSDEKGTFSGVILGVTDYGNLILKSNEREKLYYDLKEVSFI